ncbi:pentatricopeptide repeat-containing protein At4g01030, mitochondrial [Lycium ferocissimum]|uniref:pentatricopeptide repeat-containing protein At4g01030, mitochondrial n=1 Tax=Lycium ferocissimum TaxID=112874 RepID=UPI0028167F33|nr:pentatricopeptide repeat-containing protein At4g01030, mitochondrial [Lycium ferocissimum]
MEAATPLYHFISSHQPLTQNKPRCHSTNFGLVNTAETLTEISPSTSLESLSSLQFDYDKKFQSLNSVRAMHAKMIKLSKEWDTEKNMQYFISGYLEFGDFQSAAVLFFVGFAENYLYWNSFLEEYTYFGGNPCEILEVFSELHSRGVNFNTEILAFVLKICSKLRDMWLGLEVHACLIKQGFDLDVYTKCALMNFYGRCCGTESANKVFKETSLMHDSLLWNEAIMVNLRNEKWQEGLQMFRDMQALLVKANSLTISKVLQACGKLGALNEGKQIHGYVIRYALESNILISTALINMYVKNDNLILARLVFDSIDNRNLPCWNSIISGYTALGYLDDALELFHEMKSSNIKPDIITWNCLLSGHFLHGSYREVLAILRRMQSAGYQPNRNSITSVLQAVSELRHLKIGKEIHCHVIRNGLDYDLHIATSLVDMYVKNDDLTSAQAVFDCMTNRNICAWNSLIAGYSCKGHFEKAGDLLNQMKEEGIKPDIVTYNSMVSGYSTSNCIKEALGMIRRIKSSGMSPNVISWTSLVSGCSQQGYFREAFEFLSQMQDEGIRVNSITVASLLQACAGLSLLHIGKEIHCLCIRNDFLGDVYVSTALIDMYSKCGNLENAQKVFRKLEDKTLASWNSMITGFAIYGLGTEAISLFDKMRKANIQPDAITFIALLSSCKHSGLLDKGWRYFDDMETCFGVIPTIEHYSCMVDLLGRVGYLDEASDFIQSMPMEPNAAVWGALLTSCRIHGNVELGEIAAEHLFKLEPYNAANYALMMNLYALSNRWKDVDRIRDKMEAMGVKIGPVWSWLKVNQRIHIFSTAGKSHPEEGEIYFELYKLISEMKKLGYAPDTKCVYQNISEVEKEKVLLGHTEKLAITYGLIRTRNPAPIRVINNTRICSDCHTVAKYMSLLRRREIFLKDGVRFHHFRDGKCSCCDLW